MIGLYVHIPFCRRKCPYCDFYSIERADGGLRADYVSALIRDISSYKDVCADTLYFGGGTPTLLTPDQFKEIISACREAFALSGEITAEANPSSVDSEYLTALRAAGVNRISFGVQSLNDNELSALGRLHDSRGAVTAVKLAHQAGFTDISADLMLGTPYQTLNSAMESIDALSVLPINHISAYMLKIEPGTPFASRSLSDITADDDELCDIYTAAVARLAENGFMQYEISNFCRGGAVSRHNLKYWRCEEYLGFGAAAHSYYGAQRYKNPSDVGAYIKNGAAHILTDSHVGDFEEKVMLGLRLSEGVPLSLFESEPNIDKIALNAIFSELISHGLAKIQDERLSLTVNGFLVSNTIISKILNIQK